MAVADARRAIRGASYRHLFTVKNVVTGKTVSGATFTSRLISKDGAAMSAPTDTAHEIGSEGEYYIEFTAAESECSQMRFRCVLSDANTGDVSDLIIFESGLNSGVAQAGGSTTIRLATTAVATDDYYLGAAIEIVRGAGGGQVRTIIDYTGSNREASVDKAWLTNPDSSSVYVVHARKDGQFPGTNGMQAVDVQEIDASANAAALLKKLYDAGLIASSVNDASPTTGDFIAASGLSTTDDFYSDLGSMVVFTSGALAGLANRVTDYDGATLALFFDNPWPTAPANGDTFVILGHVE